MNWETLMSFGDSITIGARSYLGYPEHLGALLNRATNTKWNVINHATSGYTAIDLHRDVCLHFQNLQSHQPQVLSLLIGTNDIKAGRDAALFRIAYEQLIIKLRLIAGHKNLLLIQIPELQPNIRYPYRIGMNEQVAYYNEVICELAGHYGLDTFRFQLKETDFFDGVHLNEEGSRHAAEQLLNDILKDKGLEYIANHA